MHKQFIVSLSDLRFVRIECPQCRTKVILDMQEKSALAEKHGFFAPKECPGCRSEYDSALRNSVDALQRLYKPLLEASGKVNFVGDAGPAPAE